MVIAGAVALLLGQQNAPTASTAPGRAGRRTGRTRSHLGSRPDGQRRRSPERCSAAAGSADCPRSRRHSGTSKTLEQDAQPRRRHWLGVLLSVPVCRHLGPAQRLGGGGSVRHEDLLGLAVVAPARRASGLRGNAKPRVSPTSAKTRGSRSRQSARHPRTSPPERRAMHRLDVCDSRRRLSPSTREAKLCTRPGVRMTKR